MHNIVKEGSGESKRREGRKSEQRAGAKRIKGSIPHNTTIKFCKYFYIYSILYNICNAIYIM